MRLVIISPCRDEALFVESTVRSVVNQTRRPDRWIIIDDGSTDGTAEILDRVATEHPWIEVIHSPRQGNRELGPGVVRAFNIGLRHLGDDPFDIISKLDCDLEFDPDCFERVLALFQDPEIGMASGITLLRFNGKLISERFASYHIPGQAKFYRRSCFQQIGGLQSIYGWDILDETDARRHGWQTVNDSTIRMVHQRMQGSSFGAIKGRVIWGKGAYAIGTHPVFAVARGIFRMAEPPWIIGGLAFILGFFLSMLKPTISQTKDQALIAYLRREQLYRLLHSNRLPRVQS